MENELLSTEEKVLEHYLNIMKNYEIGSENHTKALKAYMELKDRVIQSTKIENEKYYKDRELELKEKQLRHEKCYKNHELRLKERQLDNEEYYKTHELELKEKQLENDKSNNKKSLVIESLKAIVPMGLFIGNCIFQSIWIKRLNEFETTGTYTYTSSKRLVDSIFNFKK